MLGLFRRKTFDQELEQLIMRWTNRKINGFDIMTASDIGNALLNKAEQILDQPKHNHRKKK